MANSRLQGFIIHDDEMAMYVGGRRIPKLPGPVPPREAPQIDSTGRATLRRDGFASVAGATVTLTTKPIAFSAPRRHLFVNWEPATLSGSGGHKGAGAGAAGASANATAALAVEIQDAATGRPIPPFTLQNCDPVITAGTRLQVRWRGGDSAGLGALAGRPIRLRFSWEPPAQPPAASSTQAPAPPDPPPDPPPTSRLYGFWFAATDCGESNGYAAAGGPATGLWDGRDVGGSCPVNGKRVPGTAERKPAR